VQEWLPVSLFTYFFFFFFKNYILSLFIFNYLLRKKTWILSQRERLNSNYHQPKPSGKREHSLRCPSACTISLLPPLPQVRYSFLSIFYLSSLSILLFFTLLNICQQFRSLSEEQFSLMKQQLMGSVSSIDYHTANIGLVSFPPTPSVPPYFTLPPLVITLPPPFF